MARQRKPTVLHEIQGTTNVTKALAKAAITMDKADLWQARLAVKTLRLEQREAIAEAAKSGGRLPRALPQSLFLQKKASNTLNYRQVKQWGPRPRDARPPRG